MEPKSPPSLRILQFVSLVLNDPDSLEAINTQLVMDRGIVAVKENNSLYMLRREATDAPSGTDIVAPSAGPGRWFKYPTASGGSAAADFSWWITDAASQRVDGDTPSTPELMSTFDDQPDIINTVVPTGFGFDTATRIYTNNTGGPLYVRCRAVIAGNNGSFPIPTYLFCVNGVVPDISGEAGFAENGAAQVSLATDSELFNVTCEHVVALLDGDTVELAAGYGSPSESAACSIRSMITTYTVVSVAPAP